MEQIPTFLKHKFIDDICILLCVIELFLDEIINPLNILLNFRVGDSNLSSLLRLQLPLICNQHFDFLFLFLRLFQLLLLIGD